MSLNRHFHRRREAIAKPARDWRRIHHSPWFWVGVAMFLTAILTYVFSEDLSLRPRRHGSVDRVEGRTTTRLQNAYAMRIDP